MPAKNLHLADGDGIYCHVYNKGVESRIIFADEADYQIFLAYLEEYLSTPRSPENTRQEFTVNGRVYRGVPHQPKNYFERIELLAYSLKPNHFHLLLRETSTKSLQAFLRSLCTRYSIYFNKKYQRTGPLFEGPYKSVRLKDETSLLLLTRYFHKAGGYSTYPEYLSQRETPWVRTKTVLSLLQSRTSLDKESNYKDYVEKYEPNQEEKGLLQKIVIETVNHDVERKNPAKVNLNPWSRIPELLISGAFFVLLLGIGVKNVSVPTTLGVKTTSSTTLPVTSPKPKIMVTVKNTQAKLSIDIKQKPTNESAKIGEAKGGDKFEFISADAGWYQVKLPNGSIGFILSSFIEAGGTKQLIP